MKIEIKNIYTDISLLYKNLLHWNISKFLILIWGTILGFVAMIPFAILFFVYSLVSGIPFSEFFNSAINSVYMTDFVGNIIYVLSLFGYTISYFFTFILLIKLNKGYLEGNKIEYIKNDYLNYKLYFKYLLITLLNIIIFLLPVLVFILIVSLLILIFGGIEAVSMLVISKSTNIFSILSLIIFILLIIKLYYLFYRFVFSYFLLLEENNKTISSIDILKKSFHLTSGFKKFLKFTITFLLVGLAYLPFSLISSYINGNYSDLNDYGAYLSLKDEDRNTLKSIDTYYYEGLELKYLGKEIKDIESLQNKYYILSIVFKIFKFIFIFGVYTMFLNSFYRKNILVEDENKDKKDTKIEL